MKTQQKGLRSNLRDEIYSTLYTRIAFVPDSPMCWASSEVSTGALFHLDGMAAFEVLLKKTIPRKDAGAKAAGMFFLQKAEM